MYSEQQLLRTRRCRNPPILQTSWSYICGAVGAAVGSSFVAVVSNTFGVAFAVDITGFVEDEGDVSRSFKETPGVVVDRKTVCSRVCEARLVVKVVFWSTSGLGVGLLAVAVEKVGDLVDDIVVIGATAVVTLVAVLVTMMGLPVVSVVAGFVMFLFVAVVSTTI